MGKEYDVRLMQIVEDIKSFIDGAVDMSDTDFKGYITAYASALKIIQGYLTEEERKQFKLDFEIDEKYM